MQKLRRHGKANQMLIAIIPPVVFFSGLMLYNAYKWFVPSPFTVAQTETVEALEVLDGVSATAKNGLPIPQPQSLRNGGSSRLVVSRPAADGAFTLVTGHIWPGFLKEKNSLDQMLHISFSRSSIRVESGGEPVDTVVMLPRTHISPLVVDAPSSLLNVDTQSELFASQTLLPVPAGSATPVKFTSDNGMSVECAFAIGKSGTISFGTTPQMEFSLDSMSSAWIEMPKTYRIQYQAVGAENLEIGLLISTDDGGTEPYTVQMFGEQVATIRRR